MLKNTPRTSFCNHLKGKTSSRKFVLVGVLIEKDNALEVAWTCTCKNAWIVYNVATIQIKIVEFIQTILRPFWDGQLGNF